jgi:hypothetical protein
MKDRASILVVLLCSCCLALGADAYLPRAHSHNDYEQARPLVEAINLGFCSIEADIHLANGKLLVAHAAKDVNENRTLEKLYLDPLRDRAERHGGRVHKNGPAVILLIDIKTDAVSTYQKLRGVLQKYADVLTRFENGKTYTNAITIIVSGNRPRELMLDEPVRLAAYDGRLSDLSANLPPSFAPLISHSWREIFQWQGQGEFPEQERSKLNDLVAKVHAQGKRIRFWGGPDNASAWKEMCEAGVDLINTDKLGELAKFLREEQGRRGVK